MSTVRLQLLEFSSKDRSRGAMSLGPSAYIALQISSKQKWTDGHQYTVISSEAATYGLFCEQINLLREELTTIERQAKKFFEKDKKIWMAEKART